MSPVSEIVLATLNARYIHAALGLRCLRANLGELRERAQILEFTLRRPAIEVVETLLAARPRLVGFGVYIWNVEETTRVVALLKAVAPEVCVVLGGPEVSHEAADQAIVQWADYVVAGPGELAFARLCGQVLAGQAPAGKFIESAPVPLDQLQLPYAEYSDEDIAHRFIYVEASRGCPFKCEFCLSALDKTAKPFALERFLAAMADLHARGARHFKFVDRTFNLNVQTGVRILEFFLERLDERLFLHFEIIPDHLPEALKALIVRFPPGQLQFEVGVQTFNPAVQAAISRKQDDARTEANLRWLREHSPAHLHVDLIVGLPGEDLACFGAGFDRLLALRPHEVQVGILKRLRGAPIARHAGLVFNPLPPYEVLRTDVLDFADLRRLSRFARYWDLVGNAGRFSTALPLLLADAPFARFLRFADWLYGETGMTGELALDRLFALLQRALVEVFGVPAEVVRAALVADYQRIGTPALPRFLASGGVTAASASKSSQPAASPRRQARHQPNQSSS